jgi:hypothetical protein
MARIISAGRFAITVTDCGRLTFWKGWRSLANEPGKARQDLRMELARFDPYVLVMEDLRQKRCRKGAIQPLLLFIAQAAEDEPVRLVKLPKTQCCEKGPTDMAEPCRCKSQ